MQRVLVCGDRWWKNGLIVLDALRMIQRGRASQNPLRPDQVEGIEVVIEGEAKGADTLGRLAAISLGIPVLRFPADWDKYGKAAGPIRNRQQFKEGKPTVVLAFHDDIENSRGHRTQEWRSIRLSSAIMR